ncbi:MAG TPA: efflux RND transporter periplasmic adaptor subunit [Terracidiphilus sp.]|jgi:RND family efflux transporter MFP subunit|nr:efflux RND transporter periplasmic adaptor subunit [Terracidiphilus sp.]
MPNPTNPQPQPTEHHESAPQHAPIAPRTALIGVAFLLIAAVVLAIAGIVPRRAAEAALEKRTEAEAAPTVMAQLPQPGTPVDVLTLPGNVTAYTDSPIYARTSGYLTKWYFDIGAHVRKGALLAEIATPELDQQLAQAQADLATAQANANNAKIQADRYTGLVASNAVSRQDTDTFVNQAASTSAAVHSAQANVQRLVELQGFEKVYAPFDGVVTARNVDMGQLITEGGASELFHMQALQTLRVYANLPQVFAPAAKLGAKIDLVFPQTPGKTYQGTLVRTAQAIDPVSRTLLVEIDVANRDGQLLPGSLAQAHFRAPATAQSFVVPVSALIFRSQGLQVATVVDGNKAHLIPVVIGEDDGATAQIVSGLSASDKVIQDPPDSIIEGEQVRPAQPRRAAGMAAGGR